MREGLKSHLASTAFTTSSTFNHRQLIREPFESHPPSNHRQNLGTYLCANKQQGVEFHPAPTTSSLFINASDIPKATPLPAEAPAMGWSLWPGYCRCLRIKNLTPAGGSLCKYIWKVVVCMVLTGKKRVGPDIWLKTLQQVENIERMMRIMWNTKAMRWQKASKKPD